MTSKVKVVVSTKDREFKLTPDSPLEIETSNGTNLHHELTARINLDKKLHSFLGMGYSFEHTSCYNIMALETPDRKRALELLVDPEKGAGMNLWRLCIGTADFTGTEWYSYLDEAPNMDLDGQDLLKYVEDNFSIEKDMDLIIPVARQALDINPDIRFFASPWSPPGWMKDTGTMCGGHLLSKYWDAYALYLALYVEAYQKIGLPIHAITVQNEPLHNVESMPSCKWNTKGTEERDFIKYHLGPTFKVRRLNTELWCFDHNWSLLGWLNLLRRPSRYPQTILDDKEARKYVDGIAFHHYAAFGFSNPKMMLKLREKYPDIPFYFTEGSLEYFWGSMRLPRYIKYGSSSINGWVPMIDTEGRPNNGPFQTKHSMIQRKVPENKIKINLDYYMYAQYSKYIKRGAKLLDVEITRSRGFEFVACMNPDKEVVAVITNKRRKPRRLAISFYSQSLHVNLKAHSITTLRWNLDE